MSWSQSGISHSKMGNPTDPFGRAQRFREAGIVTTGPKEEKLNDVPDTPVRHPLSSKSGGLRLDESKLIEKHQT